jgi:hypothetical protein
MHPVIYLRKKSSYGGATAGCLGSSGVLTANFEIEMMVVGIKSRIWQDLVTFFDLLQGHKMCVKNLMAPGYIATIRWLQWLQRKQSIAPHTPTIVGMPLALTKKEINANSYP